MGNEERILWRVRCGQREDTLFLENNFVVIGWGKVGSEASFGKVLRGLVDAVEAAYPQTDYRQVPVIAAPLSRLRRDTDVGHIVVYPIKKDGFVDH